MERKKPSQGILKSKWKELTAFTSWQLEDHSAFVFSVKEAYLSHLWKESWNSNNLGLKLPWKLLDNLSGLFFFPDLHTEYCLQSTQKTRTDFENWFKIVGQILSCLNDIHIPFPLSYDYTHSPSVEFKYSWKTLQLPLYRLFFSFFFFFLPHYMACGILVPYQGLNPGSSAVRGQSPNHLTAKEFPL